MTFALLRLGRHSNVDDLDGQDALPGRVEEPSPEYILVEIDVLKANVVEFRAF